MAALRAPLASAIGPVVLATGGTGGHVFPAEALAGELEARGLPFALVTDSRGRQWQGALSRRPIHYIHSASPTGSLRRRLSAVLALGLGLFDAWRALGRIGPSAVVGFGGYASVPTLIAARLRRLPAMLHEQNAVLGRANRLVLGGAARVATSFARTQYVAADDQRARLVGNPVREPVRALRSSPYRAPAEGRIIDLLVFGGSQGAQSFSQVVPEAILSLPVPLRARVRLVQQCRPEDLDRVRARYTAAGVVAELAPFFADLPARLAAAHLVIGRAGASTVAELAAIGRPSILVPYPHAADDHQSANARAFEATGACIVMAHAAFTATALASQLKALFEAPQRLGAMAAAAHAAGRPDAAARLADLVVEMTGFSLSPSGVAA
ncbi:MAG: undecaprenyldiphospho-muramoylpentapeptide beta-N-acetylglucosaminyltransferase [Rhodospirillales bacterium]|nr:undecaprenyldiphospho-muramoylpentapeptide beta-N-acetylglucosaminyltransferase [Rhodospirillales bacterium]